MPVTSEKCTGDEVVVKWPFKTNKKVQGILLENIWPCPEFKAAVRGGTVVVSEVGKYKFEIAYHGDLLNTTARMLGKCHELESQLLISATLLEQIEMPKYLKTDAMGSYQLKGKQQEVEIHSVYMTADGQSKKRRILRLFRRKMQTA